MFSLPLHELGHVAVYLLSAIPLYHFLKKYGTSLYDFLFGFLVTILIDLDHVIDYLTANGWSRLSVSEFLEGKYFHQMGKIYVFFHSWELALLLLAIYFFAKQKHKWILFVFLGIFVHLVFDTLSYGFDFKVYFLVTRILNNFSEVIFTPI